jgi:hypothetical protein
MMLKQSIKLSFFLFFCSTGFLSILQAAGLEEQILPRSVFLYPKNPAQVDNYNFDALGHPLELIYWTVGFRAAKESLIAYPKSCNPQHSPQPQDPLASTIANIHRLLERFSPTAGYKHTWMIDTCLKKHAGLEAYIENRNLASLFASVDPELINNIMQEFNNLIQDSGFRPQAIAIDIEPICHHTGANSLLGFHADLVTRINYELGLSVAVHLSCSKIHDWFFAESTPQNEGAKGEFARLCTVIRDELPGNHFLIDAFCHGGGCEHKAKGGPCTTRNDREEDSCEWQHFTSQKKLRKISEYLEGEHIPFKVEISISGASSGGIVPDGWSIKNFEKAIKKIREVIPGEHGMALFGVGGEVGRTGDLAQIACVLDH